MTHGFGPYAEALDQAFRHTGMWLSSFPTRPVLPRSTEREVWSRLGAELPQSSCRAAEVVNHLATAVEPGLAAMGSGRYFGWVMGGILPAAMAADWLVTAWDQNSGSREAAPAMVATENLAAKWLLELLKLPLGSEVGFTTGSTMAHFSCLAAARYKILRAAGWDLDANGLAGGPPVHILVGEERHKTIDVALRYLGLGLPTVVPGDDQGRIRLDALYDALKRCDGPAILCLQAGNVNSGAFDPIADATDMAHECDAWVHVDGAFGLWAAASPKLEHLVNGGDRVDSWATDAHKTLNVPYDCGIAIVTQRGALRQAMGYDPVLNDSGDAPVNPFDTVPEVSRRARGVPVWAALRSLGRWGVRDLVDGLVDNARAIADGIASLEGAEILNEVVYTQVCAAFGDDERTRAVLARLLAEGTICATAVKWRGRQAIRLSVSNWSTDAADVSIALDAMRRATTM